MQITKSLTTLLAITIIATGCASETPTPAPEAPEVYASAIKLDDGTVHYSDHHEMTELEIEEELTNIPEGLVECNGALWPQEEVLKQEEGKIYYKFADGPEWVDCDPNAVRELD